MGNVNQAQKKIGNYFLASNFCYIYIYDTLPEFIFENLLLFHYIATTRNRRVLWSPTSVINLSPTLIEFTHPYHSHFHCFGSTVSILILKNVTSFWMVFSPAVYPCNIVIRIIFLTWQFSQVMSLLKRI